MQNPESFPPSATTPMSATTASSTASARPRYERIIARPGAGQRIRWTVAPAPRPGNHAEGWAGVFEAPGDRPRTADACESPQAARRLVESMTLNWLRSCAVADVLPLLGTADDEIADCLELDLISIPVLREITTACGLFPDLFGRVLKALGAHEIPDHGWSFLTQPA
jgi:hypothetical protein